METEEKGQLPFLDVLLSKQSTSDNQYSCVTSVFRKKTYTGLLTNYFSFTPFKYKLGLIKTLIDRAYKINNTTQGFQNDIKNPRGVLPYIGYIGMCGPKGYGFSAVLVINWVSILAILPPFWS